MNILQHRRLTCAVYVSGLLLGLGAPVCAEDLTLTTYYPSPRGVYDALQANQEYVRGGTGDIDGNGEIFVNDINAFASCLWGLPAGVRPYADCAVMDVNGDGVINLLDYDVMYLPFSGAVPAVISEAQRQWGKAMANTLIAPHYLGSLELMGGRLNRNNEGNTAIQFIPFSDSLATAGIPSLTLRVGGGEVPGGPCPAGTTDYNVSPNPLARTCRPTFFTVTPTGNVGVGLPNPQTTFQVQNGTVLFRDAVGPQSVGPVGLGGGTRFMWVPNRASLRAGRVVVPARPADIWEGVNMGLASVALGDSPLARGNASVAMGLWPDATNTAAISLGRQTIAAGVAAVALGDTAHATQDGAVAIGTASQALGQDSVALGLWAMAGFPESVAIGTYVTSGTNNAFVIGHGVPPGAGGPPLQNFTANSLMIGFNSNIPTLFVGPSAGVNTTGSVGIGMIPDPSFKLDVNGPMRFGGGAATDEIRNSAGDFNLRAANNLILLPGRVVGIGTTTPSAAFTLDVNGRLRVQGKATITGGVDPPYVSFTAESPATIKEHATTVDPHEKAMLFWHAKAHRLEVYVVEEDRFYTITGEPVEE